MQNLLLMAHHLGLGTCAITGPLLARPAVEHLLGIPAGWQVVAFVAVGHADEQPAETPRRAAALVSKWLE